MINVIKNVVRNLILKISSLSSDGERVDLTYKDNIDFEKLDVYQKSHYKRYEFAQTLLKTSDVCGDFACGTGYGTVMLSKKSSSVFGGDINGHVIKKIKKRYSKFSNVNFIEIDLLKLNFEKKFDKIVSFETIEHLREEDIPNLFNIFNKNLKSGGQLIFSVPYMQERSENAIKMGFHLTFDIDENKIYKWLSDSGFTVNICKYQNYQTHLISDHLEHKDFIICIATKND